MFRWSYDRQEWVVEVDGEEEYFPATVPPDSDKKGIDLVRDWSLKLLLSRGYPKPWVVVIEEWSGPWDKFKSSL